MLDARREGRSIREKTKRKEGEKEREGRATPSEKEGEKEHI